MNRLGIVMIAAVAIAAGSAWAQLPPDAVMLDKVKVPQKQKSHELCPVHLVDADPAIPTWEHKGITYGGHEKGCEAEFATNADAFAAAADKQRWENNFVQALSIIWCPVTDEISPGGNTLWEELGLMWESCCQFCNDTKAPEDFPAALKRLKKRAAKAYAMTGAKYTEGASSPVEGAINLGGPMAMPAETPATGPAYLDGVDLKPTYAGGMALLFENRCLECHRPGGLAPMSFATHGAIRKWSAKMKEVVETRTMPPWPADASGSFGNTKRLSDVEHEALLDWIGQKYPKGEGEYTPTRDWSSEWRIGEPDHVFELGEYIIPEDVAEEIHEFKVTTNFDTDRWIVATEIKPTDTFLILEIDGGPLGAYHTGNGVTELPEGTGYLLKKGETVTVRVFYTKEKGWEEYDDSTRIGVVFAKDPAAIEKQLVVERMGNDSFTIAAGSDSTDLSSEFIFPADGELLSVTPVVRMRGKSVRMMAVLPDGSHRPLLNIPYWDPSWHFTYELAEPLKAPKGTVVKMTASYDNSDMNARNPDATVDVSAGPNGEVLEGWIAYTLD